MKSIIGRKVGMTQVFTEEGVVLPVTVVEVLPNVILQKKTIDKDGYEALQVGYEDTKEKRLNKPLKGVFAKTNSPAKKFIREIKGEELSAFKEGEEITVDIFKAGDVVDVTGISKGKGFSGTVKRYGHKIGPKAHGSGFHRQVGSLASGLTNNRIHPGRKMPGHHGNETTTILNLEVVSVDASKNVMLVKGSIPGPKKGLLTIRSAVKEQKKKLSPRTLVDYTAATAK